MPGNDPVIDQLAKHFYVIMFEPPGLIRSEPPREIWSFDDYAHHLNKLVNELEIKNSYFMGQSFGGGVSTAYAKLYPDNVKTLILVDSTMANRTRNWYYNLRFPWNAFVKKAIPSRFVPFAIKRLIVSGYFGVPLAEIGKDNLTYWITVAEIQQAHDLEVDYTSLQMPVLMIWGNKDTYVTSIDHARKTHSLIPNSTFVEVDGGHTVLFKNPEIVVNKIKENL
jgi:pimeloyl-ACP methyl ester carboxylesterase